MTNNVLVDVNNQHKVSVLCIGSVVHTQHHYLLKSNSLNPKGHAVSATLKLGPQNLHVSPTTCQKRSQAPTATRSNKTLGLILYIIK